MLRDASIIVERSAHRACPRTHAECAAIAVQLSTQPSFLIPRSSSLVPERAGARVSRPDLLESRGGRVAVGAAIAALFLAARLVLWKVREPFFDELFTRWIAQKSFAGIVAALRFDSGPPLYYFLVKLFASPRGVSLVASLIALVAMLRKRHFTAATLAALFPPAVLFAVDGRAYALCAMFVTLGLLALGHDRDWLAALAFVAAAYSHYYGVLFFPLLLRRPRTLVATLLFAPQLWLAMHQPKEAMAWVDGLRYPDALFPRIPLALLVAGIVLVAVSVARRWNLFALATALPIAMALVFAIAGRAIYVPLRFESVLAAPLLLWIGTAVEAWPAKVRRALVAAMALVFGAVTALGIADHAGRPPDPYASAAKVAAASPPVVASGYLYLESIVRSPSTIAFPREQALHPGWRANAGPAELRRELDALPPAFVWVGEAGAPELRVLRERYRIDGLSANGAAVVLRMSRRS